MFRNLKRVRKKVRFLAVFTLILLVGVGLKMRSSAPGNISLGVSMGVPINTLSFSPDDKHLVVASQALSREVDDSFHSFSGGVGVYEVATKNLYRSLPYESPLNPNIRVEAYYSKDGRFLIVNGTVTGNRDDENEGSSVFYDSATLAEINQRPPSFLLAQFAQSPSQQNNFSAQITKLNGKLLTLVKTPTRRFKVNTKDTPERLALDAANHKLAIADWKGDISLVDLNSGRIIDRFSCSAQSLIPGNEAIASFLWLPRQKLLWVSNSRGRSIFWDSALHKVKADI